MGIYPSGGVSRRRRRTPALFLGKALCCYVASESHITAQLAKMMSVRELQILGEEREEKDRMQCRESLLAFGLGKNVSTVSCNHTFRGAFALKHRGDP